MWWTMSRYTDNYPAPVTPRTSQMADYGHSCKSPEAHGTQRCSKFWIPVDAVDLEQVLSQRSCLCDAADCGHPRSTRRIAHNAGLAGQISLVDFLSSTFIKI